MEYKSFSSLETENLAQIFWNRFIEKAQKQAMVICLYGDLGAGKTVFTKGLAKFLGIKHEINSPTFVIAKKYKLGDNKFNNLFHFDFYRLENIKDLEWLNWSEIIDNKGNIVVIEWPERIKEYLPSNTFDIFLENIDEKTRIIKYEEKES